MEVDDCTWGRRVVCPAPILVLHADCGPRVVSGPCNWSRVAMSDGTQMLGGPVRETVHDARVVYSWAARTARSVTADHPVRVVGETQSEDSKGIRDFLQPSKMNWNINNSLNPKP